MTDSWPRTRIIILVDNDVTPGLGLMAEWGFSALIERGPHRVLFDTGQGTALMHNSRALGIGLSPLTCVILSHGHYDHTGGLLHATRPNPDLEVVAHPAVLGSHLALDEGKAVPRRIGIPHSEDELRDSRAVFKLITDFTQVLDGIWFTGEVPRTISDTSDSRLRQEREGRLVPDGMEDDASVLLETRSGPVLLLGCAHAGVRNILEHVREQRGIESIHAVIGGTHLSLSPRSETFAVIEALEQFDVQCIATAHCTGSGPNSVLKSHFGKRFCVASAGAAFDF